MDLNVFLLTLCTTQKYYDLGEGRASIHIGIFVNSEVRILNMNTLLNLIKVKPKNEYVFNDFSLQQ